MSKFFESTNDCNPPGYCFSLPDFEMAVALLYSGFRIVGLDTDADAPRGCTFRVHVSYEVSEIIHSFYTHRLLVEPDRFNKISVKVEKEIKKFLRRNL